MQLAKHNVGEIIIDSNITKKDLLYLSKCVLRKVYPVFIREIYSMNCTIINNV